MQRFLQNHRGKDDISHCRHNFFVKVYDKFLFTVLLTLIYLIAHQNSSSELVLFCHKTKAQIGIKN